MLWLCDIQLPAATSGVRRARGAADALDLAVSRERRDDLRLLVSEVATNAVRHGSDTASDDTIRLRFGLQGDSLRVEVHDRGPGFRHVPRGPHAELGSGWGVHFVHTLADRWGAGRGASGAWVVWFEITLSGPDAASAAGPATCDRPSRDARPLATAWRLTLPAGRPDFAGTT